MITLEHAAALASDERGLVVISTLRPGGRRFHGRAARPAWLRLDLAFESGVGPFYVVPPSWLPGMGAVGKRVAR